MQEVNRLCTDSEPLWANTVLCHSTHYSLLVYDIWRHLLPAQLKSVLYAIDSALNRFTQRTKHVRKITNWHTSPLVYWTPRIHLLEFACFGRIIYLIWLCNECLHAIKITFEHSMLYCIINHILFVLFNVASNSYSTMSIHISSCCNYLTKSKNTSCAKMPTVLIQTLSI